MNFTRKSYKAFDALLLAFQASPIYTILHIFLSVVHAIMATIAMALATSNFVDTATAILQGIRPHSDIYLSLFLLLLVLCLYMTIGSLTQLAASRITLNIERKIKPAIVKVHAALDFRHIENAGSWELISRVSRDPVRSVMDGFGALIQFLQVIISVASVFILIVTQVWWAALITISFSMPMFWLSLWAGKKNYQAGRDAERFHRRTDYLEEVLTGRDAVDERTLFDYGEAVNHRWYDQYEAARTLQLKVKAKMFLTTRSSSIILALIALLIAFTLINPVIMGLMTAGMFMGIVSAVFGMIQQVAWNLTNSLEKISRVYEYMKDLTAFLALSGTVEAYEMPDKILPEIHSLEFKNVRFKYPGGDRYILDGLSFRLEPNLHYAFVGKNGAGKTTITKLLTGLYTDYEGEILINQRELREYPMGTIKAFFSVVYQDYAKYYISLQDNIAIGDIAGDSLEQIAEMAALAGLDEMIAELKYGMNTPLGKVKENGQDISAGQWQRVAIARSLKSRAAMKILDEPTAALDPISESKLYGEFERLMQDKMTIFISHRLGSTKLADEIMVIDDGKIIERGTHDELIKANGQYAEMFEAQRGWYQ